MPLSKPAEAYLRRRKGEAGGPTGRIEEALRRPSTGDGFVGGDYSLGLFHHDASESAIELLRHAQFRDAASGSLLCLLDCADPSGRVHRVELCHKARELEPSKPVIAQFAHRAISALGEQGPEWANRFRVVPRVIRFVRFLEDHYAGAHGLMLTHSSLQSGFDSDILTAGLPDASVEGPDTNTFLLLEYRALAAILRRLGQDAAAAEWEEKAGLLRERMERLLWHEDERGGFYVGLRWQHGVGSLEGEIIGTVDPGGSIRPIETWIGLLPLYAGVPTPERAKLLVRRLLDPSGYWGPSGVRTAPANSPFFHQARRMMLFDRKKDTRGPVSNWSGPIWILPNYYLAMGLAEYGFKREARELALKTARLLAQGLDRDGGLRECYDDSGRGLWPLSGTFVSWSVLALTLLRDYCPESTRTWH
jgi:putative isomerase